MGAQTAKRWCMGDGGDGWWAMVISKAILKAMVGDHLLKLHHNGHPLISIYTFRRGERFCIVFIDAAGFLCS
jgi:hypothetical protein